jgi:hypothetical protein
VGIMARARNIKPGFFKNEDLAELDPFARLLFIGLWTIADRAGRLEDRPKRIKAELFPYDNVDVDELLKELKNFGFILRYTAEGMKYISIPKFTIHQNPHKNESPSVIPPFKDEFAKLREEYDAKHEEYSVPRTTLEVKNKHEFEGLKAELKDSKTGLYKLEEIESKNNINKATDEFAKLREEYSTTPADSLFSDSLISDSLYKDHRVESSESPLTNVRAIPPYQEIINLFNQVCISLPKVRDLTNNRKKAIKARWNKYDNPDHYREVFQKVEASDFLKGSNNRNWIADFDWLMKENNITKVLEGKYDNRGGNENGSNLKAITNNGRTAAEIYAEYDRI